MFSDPDGDSFSMNYTITPTPPSTMLTFDASACSFSFNSVNNSFAGNYTVTVHAYDYASDADFHGNYSFTIDLEANNDVQNDDGIPASISAYAHQSKNQSSQNLFEDADGDTITITTTIVPSNSHIGFTMPNYTYVHVDDTTTNSDVGTYVVTWTGSDGYSETNDATVSMQFIILENKGPYTYTSISDITFHTLRETTLTLPSTTFKDSEGDTMTYTHTLPANASFITFNDATMTFTADPLDAHAGTYPFTITATDGYSDTATSTQSCTITVQLNTGPTTTETVGDVSQLALFPIEVAYDPTLFSDANSDTINYQFIHNFTGSWYSETIDSTVVKIHGTPTNADIGTFQVTLRAYDDYTRDTNYSVTVEIKDNRAPNIIGASSETFTVPCLAAYELDLTTLFSELDLETLEYTLESNAATSWATIDNSTHKLSGTPPQMDNTTVTINLVAYDPADQTATISTTWNMVRNKDPYVSSVFPTSMNCYEGVV